MAPKRKRERIEPINTYGLPALPTFHSQLCFDRAAWTCNLPFERTGFTRPQLYRRISDKLIPGYHEWNRWTERKIEALCNYRWVAMAGCTGSGKTHDVTGFAVVDWLCSPLISAAILMSTTGKAVRFRAWKNVQMCFQMMPKPPFGNFVDSKMVWQVKRGDDRNCIRGMAHSEGSVGKVVDSIAGYNCKRMFLMVDEATSVNEGIMMACENMHAYPYEYHMVVLGNPRDHNDQHGRFCEPAGGWDSIDIDSEEWETKVKPDGKKGIVLRFDALKSPNVTEHRIISIHLPRKDVVDRMVKVPGAENDPMFWSKQRGFWAPEGIEKTVMSETLLVKHQAYSKWVFTGRTWMVGGFDPAFTTGGDSAIYRSARVGETEAGFGIQLLPPIRITLDSRSKDPITYQLKNKVQIAAENEGVEPRCLVADNSPGGREVIDVMHREWSPEVGRCTFQERPSELVVSHEDSRKACDVYRNKVTELYFQAKEFFVAGQVRGIDKETALQICARRYIEVGGKIALEDKKEFKLRFKSSPDEADALVLLLEAARRSGIPIKPVGKTSELTTDFQKEAVHAQETFGSEEVYTDANETEAMAFESVW